MLVVVGFATVVFVVCFIGLLVKLGSIVGCLFVSVCLICLFSVTSDRCTRFSDVSDDFCSVSSICRYGLMTVVWLD